MQQRHARELAVADAVAPSAEGGAGDEEAPVAQEESAAGRTGGGGKVRMPTPFEPHTLWYCRVCVACAPCVLAMYVPQTQSDAGSTAVSSASCPHRAGRRTYRHPSSTCMTACACCARIFGVTAPPDALCTPGPRCAQPALRPPTRANAPDLEHDAHHHRAAPCVQRSKGQKRRERLEQQEAHRDTELAEAVANMGTTARVAEEGALRDVLLPLGLQVVDIPVRTPVATPARRAPFAELVLQQ